MRITHLGSSYEISLNLSEILHGEGTSMCIHRKHDLKIIPVDYKSLLKPTKADEFSNGGVEQVEEK